MPIQTGTSGKQPEAGQNSRKPLLKYTSPQKVFSQACAPRLLPQLIGQPVGQIQACSLPGKWLAPMQMASFPMGHWGGSIWTLLISLSWNTLGRTTAGAVLPMLSGHDQYELLHARAYYFSRDNVNKETCLSPCRIAFFPWRSDMRKAFTLSSKNFSETEHAILKGVLGEGRWQPVIPPRVHKAVNCLCGAEQWENRGKASEFGREARSLDPPSRQFLHWPCADGLPESERKKSLSRCWGEGAGQSKLNLPQSHCRNYRNKFLSCH